ncbi:m120.1 protein [Murid betaherpesvirus 1]|uniref:M120.1 protein n=1 Tax=Murid herpesvirus 1 TaxID=10366 RepID=H2A2F1_MUHV1|nr:m120.1 protein [Murid betaherpesvirus 1]
MGRARSLLCFAVILCVIYLSRVQCKIDWKVTSTWKTTNMTCIGTGDTGSWSRVYNKTDYLIGSFQNTTVVMEPYGLDGGYGVYVKVSKSGETITTLTMNTTRHGGYRCKIGTSSKLLYLEMPLTVSSTTGLGSIQMDCRPHNQTPPYTILWILNSTLGARSTIYAKNNVTVKMENGTGFFGTDLFGVNDGVGSYYSPKRPPQPACLICIVSKNDSYGSATRCTTGMKDMGSSKTKQSPGFETIFLHSEFMRATGERPSGGIGHGPDGEQGPGDDPTPPAAAQPTGVFLVVVVACFLAGVAAAIFTIHHKGKHARLSRGPSDMKVYKPCNRTESQRSAEITEL